MSSQSVEEYVEAIYRLGGEDGSVSTGGLASHLKVAAPSVTTMLKRLVRDGLVVHTPYHGIALTQSGLDMATTLIRNHRLSERLLTDVIGLSWDEVHEVACKLEHVITGDLADKVYHALGEPQTCPHGNPVSVDRSASLIRLIDLEPGSSARVARITNEDQSFLRYLQENDIQPGASIAMVSKAPFGNVVNVEVNGVAHSLGSEVASTIWVRPVEKQD
jgi:DtxR family Mn-dependent transcriptional regulator